MQFIEFNEQDALARLVKGDEKAFKEIYDHYWRFVYHTIRRRIPSAELAQDISQEIFVDIWRRRESFKNIESLQAYLRVMGRNIIAKTLKELAKEAQATNEYIVGHGRHLPDNTLNDKIIETDYNNLLQEAVAALSPTQKTVFQLAKEEGLNQEAIAERLNMSYLAVRQNMNRALMFLRKRLNRHIIGIIILWLKIVEMIE